MKVGGQILWNAFSYLRNIQDLLSDGKTPYERRFGKPFKGRVVPFGGGLVDWSYLRRTSEDSTNLERKSYLDCSLDMLGTRGGIWKGDILVADIEDLEMMDASEIYSERLGAKEVIFPKENGILFSPAADGRIKLSGGDHELRTPTLIQEHPIRGESQRDFLGESEGSLPPPQDSLPDAGEAINDFWSMSGSFMYRHYVEPRVKLYSPERRIIP